MKYFNIFFLLALTLILLVPGTSKATSGACSYHGGVNCGMGRQSNGNVYCNDTGWTDSMVKYDFMAKCVSPSANSCINYSPDCKYFEDINLLNNKKAFASAKLSETIESWEKFKALGIPAFNDEISRAYVISMTIDKGRLIGTQMDYICNCTKIDAILDRYDNDYAASKNTILCNGKTWNNCTSGQSFYCPSTGDAQCLLSAPTKIASCPTDYILRDNECLTKDQECKKYANSGSIWDEAKQGCVLSKSAIVSIMGTTSIPEGAIIRAENDIDVYIVKYVGSKKFKRLVLSPSVFNNYGHLKWENLMVVSQLTLDSFVTSDLVRAVGDDKIYRLYPQGDSGQKRLLKDSSVITKLGLDSDSIYEINSFDRESYISGAALE